ncbi:MAG: PilZ domain-containing protein, partial [Candidatus Omnitrophota bacterium]|nr:PilZ domain-containing protein [Candidatus Omnitrophota bacterium]
MDKIDSLKERRLLPRIPVLFPIKVSPGIIGETVNLNETGLCLALEKPIISARILSVQIDLPFPQPFEFQGELIWTQDFAKNNRYLCGVQFLKLSDDKLSILRDAMLKSKSLNRDFISLTKKLRLLLLNFKKRFD